MNIEGELHTLRRLYHHVAHGGKTTPRDEERCGFEPTLARLSARISELEEEKRQRDEKEFALEWNSWRI